MGLSGPENKTVRDFYPRPPRGGRPGWASCLSPRFHFYPRPPRGGRRGLARQGHHRRDFYPRPPRGGRLPGPNLIWQSPPYFYPRPPRGGRRHSDMFGPVPILFLSTSSARRTTRSGRLFPPPGAISIHVLREEDDGIGLLGHSPRIISIHVLREEDDRRRIYLVADFGGISIHVLREEDDQDTPALQAFDRHFYPRPPRGGRRAAHGAFRIPRGFLSTSSARRTTTKPSTALAATSFLSTSSARRTTGAGRAREMGAAFLSTSSARRTTVHI